jgi:hypothetical protein
MSLHAPILGCFLHVFDASQALLYHLKGLGTSAGAVRYFRVVLGPPPTEQKGARCFAVDV